MPSSSSIAVKAANIAVLFELVDSRGNLLPVQQKFNRAKARRIRDKFDNFDFHDEKSSIQKFASEHLIELLSDFYLLPPSDTEIISFFKPYLLYLLELAHHPHFLFRYFRQVENQDRGVEDLLLHLLEILAAFPKTFLDNLRTPADLFEWRSNTSLLFRTSVLACNFLHITSVQTASNFPPSLTSPSSPHRQTLQALTTLLRHFLPTLVQSADRSLFLQRVARDIPLLSLLDRAEWKFHVEKASKFAEDARFQISTLLLPILEAALLAGGSENEEGGGEVADEAAGIKGFDCRDPKRVFEHGELSWQPCWAQCACVEDGCGEHRVLREGEELMACAKCMSIRYCSPQHQRAHWQTHKALCFKPSCRTLSEKDDARAIQLSLSENAQETAYLALYFY